MQYASIIKQTPSLNSSLIAKPNVSINGKLVSRRCRRAELDISTRINKQPPNSIS
jgi:hypothetical protein